MLFLVLAEELEHLLLFRIREVFHLVRRFASVLDDRVGLLGGLMLSIEGFLDLGLREGEALTLDRVQRDDRLVVLEERDGDDVADVEHGRHTDGFIGATSCEQLTVHAFEGEEEGLVSTDDGVAGTRDAHGAKGLLRKRGTTRCDGVAIGGELLSVGLERSREIALDDEGIDVLHRDQGNLLEEGLFLAHDGDDPGRLAEDVVRGGVGRTPGRRIRAELAVDRLHRTVFGGSLHRVILRSGDAHAGIDEHEPEDRIVLRIVARDADAPVELRAELDQPEVAGGLHTVTVIHVDVAVNEFTPVLDLLFGLRHRADAIDPRRDRAVRLVLAGARLGVRDDHADGLFTEESDGRSHDAVRVVRVPVLVDLEGDVAAVGPGHRIIDLAVHVVAEDRFGGVLDRELLPVGILGDEGCLTVGVLCRHADVSRDDVALDAHEVGSEIEREDPPEFATHFLYRAMLEVHAEE